MTRSFTSRSIAGPVPIFAFWLLAHGGLWYLLAKGDGWAFGFPTIIIASALAAWLQVTPWSFRLHSLPLFLVFFIHSAWNGAVDVARRSLLPHLRLEPIWVRFQLTEDDERVRQVVSGILGLFPGTLASRIENNQLHVHVLDQSIPWQRNIARLEKEVAKLLLPRKHRAEPD